MLDHEEAFVQETERVATLRKAVEDNAASFGTNLSAEDALKLISEEYVNALIYLTSQSTPDLKELNYIKTEIVLPNGGIYLLSLLHVSGPKINLDKVRSYDGSDKG